MSSWSDVFWEHRRRGASQTDAAHAADLWQDAQDAQPEITRWEYWWLKIRFFLQGLRP
jgi:hypothetical protein